MSVGKSASSNKTKPEIKILDLCKGTLQDAFATLQTSVQGLSQPAHLYYAMALKPR